MRSKNHAAIFSVFVSIFAVFILSLNASSIDPYPPNIPSAPVGTITFDINDTPTLVDTRILGTNLPAWVNPTRTENVTFRARTSATGTTMIRIPGGSWSNYYEWENCEKNNACPWTWGVLTPTDFINFIRAVGGEAMYTVNQNRTSKEAAAAVAFFNGSVNDDTVIGFDVRDRDWGKVSDWAQLRSDNGNPDPLYIEYWEIGNEIYGGKPGLGTDCTFSNGWETVWTCDGTEYVDGIGSGADRKEGYLEFRDSMRVVDPTIMVGAVGIPSQSSWSNWGNEVIAAAGSVMDFYIIHEYAYNNAPATYQDALAQPQSTWQPIMADVEAAFDQHAGGRRVPIAITEHNLFNNQDQDWGKWMTRAVNMLFVADSIGQMMKHGYAIANQWDLANGAAIYSSFTDYGLMEIDNNTYARSPQYYPFPLWADFGSQMLPVTSSYDAATTLSVYAGKIDTTTAVVLAINKTGNNQTANIQVDGVGQISGGTASVVQATSLDNQSVTFNGVSDPADDLSDAPPTAIIGGSNPLAYTFVPYSITLLRLELGDVTSQLSVDDVTVTEGDSGTTNATFTVSLSPPISDTVMVNYATNNGSATAGSDYTAVSSTLTFNPGQTTKTVNVPIIDDATFEVPETFSVTLSNASNANIADAVGTGTIIDDDAPEWVYLPVALK